MIIKINLFTRMNSTRVQIKTTLTFISLYLLILLIFLGGSSENGRWINLNESVMARYATKDACEYLWFNKSNCIALNYPPDWKVSCLLTDGYLSGPIEGGYTKYIKYL